MAACHDLAIPVERYDSTATLSLREEARELWARRQLVALVARRQLQLRYQRSVLGVWWTLLQPMFEMAVLWVVFSKAFRFSSPDAPYVVYLLSGLAMAGLVRNAILAIASSLNVNAALLTRVRVPGGLFPAAALADGLTSFVVGLGPLLVIMLIAGPGLSPTMPLIVLPAAIGALFALGVGLALAPLSARFPDTIVLTGVGLTLVTYLAPVFYPIGIVPRRYVHLIDANPLYHFIALFRANLYGDSIGRATDYAIAGGATVIALAIGVAVFRRFGRPALMHL